MFIFSPDDAVQMKPVITAAAATAEGDDDEAVLPISPNTTVADLTKALIHFIAAR